MARLMHCLGLVNDLHNLYKTGEGELMRGLVWAVVEERKKEKRLQILGTLAWGSFLDSYTKKAKPRPKSFFLEAYQRWTLKGVFRFFHFASAVFQRSSLFSFFLSPAVGCPRCTFWWATTKKLLPVISGQELSLFSTVYTTS